MSHRRAAVIDIGTNSVLLTIAERTEEGAAPASGGAVRAIVERATITRLGEGVDRTRRLAPEAVERTLACLRDYVEAIRGADVDGVALVGTSALRDAEGGEPFVQAASELVGAPLEVISGAREAELTFRGALSGLSVTGPVRVFDIGGGSTEIIAGTATDTPPRAVLGESYSYDLGSVRLTERHVRTDPPAPSELTALREDIRRTWATPDAPRWNAVEGQSSEGGAPFTTVGVAGTVTTLAAVALGLSTYDPDRVHGATLRASQVNEVAARLAALPLAERKQLPGLEPRRADVIVAGAILCAEVLTLLGAEELVVSDRGVRWGLLDELFGQRARATAS